MFNARLIPVSRMLVTLASLMALLAGCASSQMKARKEQRDKAAQSSKLYCDFVNGELYPDVEVMLNLEMAKHCDSDKSFSVTNYKTTNENMGLVYCCALPDNKGGDKEAKAASKTEAPAEAPKKEAALPKPVDKAPEKPAAKAGDKPADKPAAGKSLPDDELGD